MKTDLHFLTIAEAGQQIKAKKLSPVEYVDHLSARVESLDDQLSAFITLTFGLARLQAKAAESEITAGRYLGPMHGIPFGAKDIYETAGILTTGGSRIGQQHVPTNDCAVVAKLYEAGAVLLGKLNTHEFAHGGPSLDLPWPPVRNPWDLSRFSGGSSSGSGAAVAAGLVGAALGTDTGGSIRGPASLCGIAGFMPSSGLVSRVGVMPNSFTLDHCGPMAWTVEDCALMLQAIAGHDPADGNSFEQPIPNYAESLGQDLKGLRVGVLRYVWEEDLVANEEHRQALEQAVETFKKLGASVQDCRLRPMQDYMDVKVVLAETEIFGVQQQGLAERPHDYGRDFLTRILPAVMFQSLDYLAATREHKRMLEEMKPIYEKFDLLLMPGFGPAQPITAHRPMTFWRKPNAQVLANITGGPAVSVNCGFNSAGLPMGLQLVGAPLADALVLKAGHAFEQAIGLRHQRPELKPGQAAPALVAPDLTPDTSHCDAQTRAFAARMATNAGLKLDEALMEVLCEAAPHALEMTSRLRKNRNWFDEPANVFRSGQ
ncbi:MAG: amidase [Burkholderiaceae bacterium]|jgi:aspartyl-tRNA(Asn)/glutamyl-tRNA(Gln) amidotransferase subunit A|nr:amidase [Burkholderiaceae bacterium]MDP4968809.1 amidase [Burkholderiaceae bacterium]MDP5111538.1 amidase [Burkholderiaceae bacterium]